MALIDYNLFGKIDKVQLAIDRLRAFEPEEAILQVKSKLKRIYSVSVERNGGEKLV